MEHPVYVHVFQIHKNTKIQTLSKFKDKIDKLPKIQIKMPKYQYDC